MTEVGTKIPETKTDHLRPLQATKWKYVPYHTLILTINKRFENGNSFDANICTVIHIVEGYVILAETIGLISFHGSELSYSILSRKK